jgi:hypothetical protein
MSEIRSHDLNSNTGVSLFGHYVQFVVWVLEIFKNKKQPIFTNICIEIKSIHLNCNHIVYKNQYEILPKIIKQTTTKFLLVTMTAKLERSNNKF